MKIIKLFKSIESFETERLSAIKLTSSDLNRLTEMHTNPQTMATLGGVWSAKKIQENLDWNLKQWTQNGFGLWMFYLKDTNEWVGRGGIRRVTVEGVEEVEVAYALMPKFWQQGFATEIAKACTEIAFEFLRLNDLVCFTLTTNKASQRVMEKAGFQYERNFTVNYDGVDYPQVLYRLKNYRKVEITPYDNTWPEIFKQESQKIQIALGNSLKEIHHIGSTSIPGMPAKPIIDILLECDNIDEIDKIKNNLHPLGYFYLRRQVIPHRSFFTSKKTDNIGFNVHIYEVGDPQIKRHVNFRDYLIHNPIDAKNYAELKLSLAKKFYHDMNNYVIGKDALVQEIDAKAKLWPSKRKNFLPPKFIKSFTQEKSLKAIVANLNLHMIYFAQYLKQVELVRIPGITLVSSGLPDDTFNYVLDADFSESQASNKIAEVTHYFKKKNIPFSWWISPYDKPENLSDYLEKQNFLNTENNIAMYLDLDTWKPPLTDLPELEIIRAKDEKTLRDFALVLATDPSISKKYFSWIASILREDDPLEYYVGYVNGKPVVRGLICYYAGVAGLYWLSTTPDARRKGYATAMQQYRLKRAKELGYHIAVLQASKEGYSLYQKLGYKECGVFREFKY